MTDVVRAELTQQQIQDLGQKLDQLGQNLNDEERSALLAVFGLAEQAMAEHGANQAGAAPATAGAPVPLSEGFDSIFQSGLGAGMQTGEGAIGQVGVQVSWQR